MRLVDTQRVNWQNRSHFLAVAARLMRRVLVDAARARTRQKRGGVDALHITLTDGLEVAQPCCDVTALDEALGALDRLDPRRGQVVELRFFGGLSVAETAAALGVSQDTVMRDWKLARAWLRRELGRGSS
jgi:RNA polymerase sigma factor (TIGR02999 family)